MKNIGQEKLHCKEISVFQIPDMIHENIQIKQANKNRNAENSLVSNQEKVT